MFEVLGIAGIVISMAAYVPQIVHLEREHCSEGVSSRAWAMWLAGGLCIGALALHHRDPVFIALQACTLASASVILLLAWRYRDMACGRHARHGSRPSSARAAEFGTSSPTVAQVVSGERRVA